MTLQKYAEGRKELKLGFVGAGGINFGCEYGTWNHAARLNKFAGLLCTLLIQRQCTSQTQAQQHSRPLIVCLPGNLNWL